MAFYRAWENKVNQWILQDVKGGRQSMAVSVAQAVEDAVVSPEGHKDGSMVFIQGETDFV